MKTTKANSRINLSILSIAFIVLLISSFIMASFVGHLGVSFARAYDPSFDGGTGTQQDPYLVSNSRHLNNVRYNLDSYFLQTDNIDASDIENFTPIGNVSIPFAGDYNGSQFIISNLNIDSTSKTGVGLFAFLTGTVDGVKLYDSKISGESNVGGIVGINKGVIKNSTNQASVTATKSNAGGIVGLNQGIVQTSSNRGNVRTSAVGFSAGGIAGTNFNDIIDTYNLGNISGGTYVGGIVGSNNNQNGTASIVNSFNYGASFSGRALGQIAGENTKSSFGYGNIQDVAWLKSSPDIAAAFGAVEIVTDENNNKTTTTNIIVKNAKSMLAQEFANKNSFSTWSKFDTNWEIRQNAKLPTLKIEYVKAQSVEFVDGNQIELQAEQSTTLKVKINPINATLQDAVFEIVQGESFATLDKYTGEIRINNNTPVGSNITLQAKVEDVATTLQITTVKIGVYGIEEIKIAENKTIISYGEVLHLSTIVLPKNSSFQNITWRTNVSFADINQDGELTLNNQDLGGEFTVTAQSADNTDIYTTLAFTTTTQGPGFVVDFDNPKEFFVVDSLTLNPRIVSSTDQIINKEIRLEIVQGDTTNTANATLNTATNTLTAQQPGIVVIRAYVDSMYWEDTITVKRVPVEKVEFVNKATMLLREANGTGLQLQTVVTPSNATYPNVTLTIDTQNNTANATLDTVTNILKATRVGEVTINAVADGKDWTPLKINILPNPIEDIELQLSDSLKARNGHLKQKDKSVAINLSNSSDDFIIKPVIKPFDATYDFGEDIKVYYEAYDQNSNKTISKTLASDNKYFKYDVDNKMFTVTEDAPINHTIRIIVDIYEFSQSVDFKIDFAFENEIIDNSSISDDGLFQLANFGDKVDGIIVGGNKYDLKLLKYEIAIKNGTAINFNRTINTNDAKLRLLLYRNTSLSQYDISLKMFFSQNNIQFDYTIERVFSMQKNPQAQVSDFNNQQSNITIVSFDFDQSGAISFNKEILANSKLQAMYIYGNSSWQNSDLRLSLSNNNDISLDLYFNNFRFTASSGYSAIVSSAKLLRISNIGISTINGVVNNTTINANSNDIVFAGNGTLNINGARGTDASGYNSSTGVGNTGGNGAIAISARSVSTETNSTISLNIVGGNGGNGATGKGGSTGDSGRDTNNLGDFGTTGNGTAGTGGYTGGQGGNGAVAINATSINFSNSVGKISITGGTGGQGGKGGTGGTGGRGGDSNGGWVGAGGLGAAGGRGGDGGIGGNAAKATTSAVTGNSQTTVTNGSGGRGGDGGNGGTGGRGGNAGGNSLNGKDGGHGGNGGQGGNSGLGGVNVDSSRASRGSAGQGGSGGNGGYGDGGGGQIWPFPPAGYGQNGGQGGRGGNGDY
ncbi:MAG: hypothetical protein LBU60_02735 [Clostridiales bacterium]|jgi:hypothetical protein|nr:hypothetical protein [Clostridiales bacterium]